MWKLDLRNTLYIEQEPHLDLEVVARSSVTHTSNFSPPSDTVCRKGCPLKLVVWIRSDLLIGSLLVFHTLGSCSVLFLHQVNERNGRFKFSLLRKHDPCLSPFQIYFEILAIFINSDIKMHQPIESAWLEETSDREKCQQFWYIRTLLSLSRYCLLYLMNPRFNQCSHLPAAIFWCPFLPQLFTCVSGISQIDLFRSYCRICPVLCKPSAQISRYYKCGIREFLWGVEHRI